MLKLPFLLILIFFLIVFFKIINDHRKLMRSIRASEKWLEFNQQVTSWISECDDPKSKIELLKYGMIILETTPDEHKIKNFKKTIVEKWGNHIPSLRQEFREIKLNQLLN